MGYLLLLQSCSCAASHHSVVPVMSNGLIMAPHAAGSIHLLFTWCRAQGSLRPFMHVSFPCSSSPPTTHLSPQTQLTSSTRELSTWLAPVSITQGLPQGQCSACPMAVAGFHASLPWETLNSQGSEALSCSFPHSPVSVTVSETQRGLGRQCLKA